MFRCAFAERTNSSGPGKSSPFSSSGSMYTSFTMGVASEGFLGNRRRRGEYDRLVFGLLSETGAPWGVG